MLPISPEPSLWIVKMRWWLEMDISSQLCRTKREGLVGRILAVGTNAHEMPTMSLLLVESAGLRAWLAKNYLRGRSLTRLCGFLDAPIFTT
jgi:hypothetical protein